MDERVSCAANSLHTFRTRHASPTFLFATQHFSGPLPLSAARLGEDEVSNSEGASLRAVTVGGRLALDWDSKLVVA